MQPDEVPTGRYWPCDEALELFERLTRETHAATHQVIACISRLTRCRACLWAAIPLPLFMAETGLSESGARKGLARALETGSIARRGHPGGPGHSYEYALTAALAHAERQAGHPVRAGPNEKREDAGQRPPATSDVQPAGNLAEAAPDPDRSEKPRTSPPTS